ncbi:MAG: hypothetical protein PHV97_06985 [Candidatus Omnitrophica bacterium]|nr:hypothetical protein [Candidatus Omnitrophota bacterium]
MNKFLLLFLAVYLGVFIPAGGAAQNYNDPQYEEKRGKPSGEGSHLPVEIPSGMELINMGGIRMIVPQGMKIEKKGSLMTMEGSDEFSARNFKEMKERLDKIEASQKDLIKTVDDLKKEISKKSDAVQGTGVRP